MEIVTLAKIAPQGLETVFGSNWVASEKKDGMRFIWDGGISRGLPASEVPYAAPSPSNCGRIATGLWSRAGNIITPPAAWLDSMPKVCLDGELMMPGHTRQELFSTVKTFVPDALRWALIVPMVFDAVPLTTWFTTREWIQYEACLLWYKTKAIVAPDYRIIQWDTTWANRISIAEEYAGDLVEIVPYVPASQSKALMNIVRDSAGEGIMLRRADMLYELKRTSNLLKVKDIQDAEAIILGHTPGKGKYEGMLGAYNVKDTAGHVFNISGMDDHERANPQAVGSTIRFLYRGISSFGVPQEARLA